MEKNSKILILGHKGLVGSSVIRELEKQGYENIVTAVRNTGNRYDLRDPREVDMVFHETKPEYVFLCAAKVGGIMMNNNQSGDMIHDNIMLQTNVIEKCHSFGVKKLLFLGSSCIYPKHCPQPIKEEYLLSGELEKTNIGYAVAKIAGLVMCEMYQKQFGDNFISVMPTNLYGPGDNFHLENSHVLPAMIRKFHEAKTRGFGMIELWGSGTPMREFLYIDDLAEGLVHLMNNYDESEIINIGTGEDVTIQELAETVKEVVGFEGTVMWDASKPDGTPRKLLDVSKINEAGWKSKTELKEGIEKTYKWFLENQEDLRV
jgi:GDP-L-fucose synthase